MAILNYLCNNKCYPFRAKYSYHRPVQRAEDGEGGGGGEWAGGGGE